MNFKEFLAAALASGEHVIHVIAPGGVTVAALNHDSFLGALLEAVIAFESKSNPLVGVGVSALESVIAAATHAPDGAPIPPDGLPTDSRVPAMPETAPATMLTSAPPLSPAELPAPTDAQIAAYLARQAESSDAVRTATVVDAATGAPQGTFHVQV